MAASPLDLRADRRRWFALAVLCLALSAIVIDNTILNVALPTLRRDLRANETDLQWITTAYALVLSGLLLPLAVLGDRFGRRRLLLAGLVTFGTASTVAAFTSSPMQLAVARGVMGVGGAATMPATLSILGNIFSEAERGRAIAIWTGVAGLAAAAGPVVGGLLLSRFWWGSVFLVNVPVVLLTVAGAVALVPSSRAALARAIDTPGAALWSGALAGLLFAIIEGPVRGWGSAPVIASFAGAAGLMGLFARREKRAPTPMLSPAAARHPGMRAGAATVTGVFFAVFGTQFVLTQWIQGPLRHGALAAGLYFAPFALSTVVTATRNPILTRRWGHHRVIVVGMGVMAAALVVAALAVSAHQLGVMVVALAVVGAGEGAALPSGVELIMTSVPPEQAGSAAGVHETIVEAAGAVGVAVLGSTLADGGGFSAPLVVAVAALVVAASVVRMVGVRRAVA
jgi:DHA2 family multidrug resistance protein-like MFS transporter